MLSFGSNQTRARTRSMGRVKEMTRDEFLPNRCKSCGVKCMRRYCDKCSKDRRKTGGLPEMCALCDVVDHCPTRGDALARTKCTKCDRSDSCNAVRGGLCLGCYAHKYCEEHPILLDNKEIEARRRALHGEAIK